ncbi:MAG: hypothetical protein HY569_02710 [Candidatus Magasanikbacteria bacterium]|nr:hypothetical protein [Candidatus Magasanikbacteria bacterium]
MKSNSQKFLFLVVITALYSFFWLNTAKAVEPEVKIKDEAYAAKFVSQSINDPITITAGETTAIKLKFKNIGTAAWNSSGSRFISAYTMDPRDRVSVFKGSDWLSGKQTAKISGKVSPNEIGELAITLKAPEKTGEYLEKFYLAAENYSWVKGGYFFLKIKVAERPKPAVSESATNDSVAEEKISNDEYQAKRVGLGKKQVAAVGGEKIKQVLTLMNKGTAVWQKYRVKFVEPATVASLGGPNFADADWENAQVALSGEESVAPDGFLRLTFNFRTPAKRGNYVAKFLVEVDGNELEEIEVAVPVEVTEDAPENYQAPTFSEAVEAFVPRLTEEPRLRVGINLGDDAHMQFMSANDDYIVSVDGETKGVLPKNKIAILRYKDGEYSFDGGGLEFSSPQYVRLSPQSDQHAVFTVFNLKRAAKWVTAGDHNHYRGAVEFRRGEVDGKFYVVNDLLLEDYVAGMAETSDKAPIEFIKANMVAVRNYAYFNKGKYPFFDVIANTYDQLYLGYDSEMAMSSVAQAARDTRGVMVTYNNEIVTTPYFGNSNGWTKSWKSVWGGADKPWLQPVKAGYDSGRSKKGHGVGMSQRDAAIRADKEGLSFEELLKYYYTGVKVERVYL